MALGLGVQLPPHSFPQTEIAEQPGETELVFPAWTNTWGSEVNDLEDFPSGAAWGEKSDIIWDTCLQFF